MLRLARSVTWITHHLQFMTQTQNTTQEKVFQLCQELEEMKKRKKSFVKAYNEEIKRLQSEIKDLINPEEAVDLP